MQTSDVSIASKSLPLIQTKKTSKTISENSTINKESIKELKPRKHLALRKPINLFMYTRKLSKQIFRKKKRKRKKRRKEKICAHPKNFTVTVLGMGGISDQNCLTMIQLCGY